MPGKITCAALGFTLTTIWACAEPSEPVFDAGPPIDSGELVTDAPPVDPLASCLRRLIIPDLDSDGHYTPPHNSEYRELCIDTPVPLGFVALETAVRGDCDDHDPLRWQSYCVDLDGDGAKTNGCTGSVLPESTQSCPVVSEWRPEPDPFDCDDHDPTRIHLHHRDADGDGSGIGTAICIAAAAGWSISEGDCDDADASRRPGEIEWFDDGRDSDCNGRDEGSCSLTSPSELTWPAQTGACAGTDLALGFLSCAGCASSSAALAVENRGASALSADVMLVGSALPPRPPPVFHLELAPGARRLLMSGSFGGEVELRLAAPGAADCHPEDNRIRLPDGHCI